MPKLCLTRLGVSSPFSWPRTQTDSPSNLPAADDRFVLAEIAVAGERGELGDEPLDVVAEMRPPLGARDLRFLPGRQAGVEIGQRLFGPGLELVDFVGERRRIALLRHGAHFIEAGLEVSDRRFKAEIGAHPVLAANRTGGGGARKLATGAAKSSGAAGPPTLASGRVLRHERRFVGV